VLARMRADSALADVPVLVISSEGSRAEALLRCGAQSFLRKPVRPQALLAEVARVLDESAARRSQGSLAILAVQAGPHPLAVPVEPVRAVLHQLATRALPMGPSYLKEMFEWQGQPVCVLDLPRRLGVEHQLNLPDRALLVLERDGLHLALCLDHVHDPEVVPAAELVRREKLGGADHPLLQQTLLAVARTSRGPLPVIDPFALLSHELLSRLPQALAGARDLPWTP